MCDRRISQTIFEALQFKIKHENIKTSTLFINSVHFFMTDRLEKHSSNFHCKPIKMSKYISQKKFHQTFLVSFCGGHICYFASQQGQGHHNNIYQSLCTYIIFLFSLSIGAGSPQQREPITVGPYYLSHPVNVPCGTKPECQEKTQDFQHSIDYYTLIT